MQRVWGREPKCLSSPGSKCLHFFPASSCVVSRSPAELENSSLWGSEAGLSWHWWKDANQLVLNMKLSNVLTSSVYGMQSVFLLEWEWIITMWHYLTLCTFMDRKCWSDSRQYLPNTQYFCIDHWSLGNSLFTLPFTFTHLLLSLSLLLPLCLLYVLLSTVRVGPLFLTLCPSILLRAGCPGWKTNKEEIAAGWKHGRTPSCTPRTW